MESKKYNLYVRIGYTEILIISTDDKKYAKQMQIDLLDIWGYAKLQFKTDSGVEVVKIMRSKRRKYK